MRRRGEKWMVEDWRREAGNAFKRTAVAGGTMSKVFEVGRGGGDGERMDMEDNLEGGLVLMLIIA